MADVTKVTGVTRPELFRKTRGFERFTLARFMVYHLMRQHQSGFTLSEIGTLMRRTHGAVISGIRALHKRAAYDKKLQRRIKLLREMGYKI